MQMTMQGTAGAMPQQVIVAQAVDDEQHDVARRTEEADFQIAQRRVGQGLPCAAGIAERAHQVDDAAARVIGPDHCNGFGRLSINAA